MFTVSTLEYPTAGTFVIRPLSAALKVGVAKCKPATKDATVAIEVEARQKKSGFIEFEKVGWLKYFLGGKIPPGYQPWISATSESRACILRAATSARRAIAAALRSAFTVTA